MSKINLDISKRVDITCRKGDTFKLSIDVTDSAGAALNLSGYTIKMEVRNALNADASYTHSDTAIILSTVASSGTKQLTTSLNDGGTTGRLVITGSNTNMAAAAAGEYVYDIEALVSGEATTWLAGTFTINDDVSV